MLEAITTKNREVALTLLAQGFKRRRYTFWVDCLDRLISAHNLLVPRPAVGYLILGSSGPVGVVLTPTSERLTRNNQRVSCLNISSLYIDPAHRWMGFGALRNLLKQPHDMFTDLTPTRPVSDLLIALGFTPLNRGETIIALPYAAMTGLQHNAIGAGCTKNRCASAWVDTSLLTLHRKLNCTFAIVDTSVGPQTLVFKHCTIRGVPAARLVYADDNNVVYNNIGAIARYLLFRGIFLLVLDIPNIGPVPGVHRAQRGHKFWKTRLKINWSFNGTNYLGSELSLFDF